MKTISFFLLLCFSAIAFAQSSSRFTITRSVLASGGTTFSTSSRFQVGSTIAQPSSCFLFFLVTGETLP